jgi:hypothetical protein
MTDQGEAYLNEEETDRLVLSCQKACIGSPKGPSVRRRPGFLATTGCQGAWRTT